MSQVAHQTLRNSVLRDPRTASKRKILEAVRGGEVWRPLAVIALQTYLDEKYHGARVRARVEAVEAEERPSLRFYQSVSSSAGDRRVPSVRATDGTVVSDPHGIVRVYKEYYSSLFTRGNVDLSAQADLLRGISKTVPHDVNDILGGEITTVELWKALSKMKNGKSPGSDGLPREFYRTFWAIIGPDIRAVFEDAFQNGLLNQSQRLGMITLLPKSGDPLDPHNKRPITLLNVDYKLLAKALCNRLALAMPHLVGDLQTCAVKGHCIQQNLWLMRDLTDFVIERDLPCALVSLDQQKAFDMVDRGFLMNVLETFQLHPNFRKWISVLYEESFSSVIVNGFCSEVFNVERGVRQGCPLSPLLYVLFSESLSRLLERDSKLVPFVVPGGAKVKCAQYADDVTCIVSSLGSFRALSQDLSF
ncbi:hypothetical protein BSL78_28626 [Apostichopus japonicus]|uniref:Reverse transcriptase domain-containing protein n=1 Tax=Stichopus japonicus TaxID=307972 RepID=A0A2G8JFN4_STIJA|nr:hypothetical protein BSL78_28626 [Apostichopus japonicus]